MHLQMHAPKAMGTTLWIGVRPRRSVVLAAAPFYPPLTVSRPSGARGHVKFKKAPRPEGRSSRGSAPRRGARRNRIRGARRNRSRSARRNGSRGAREPGLRPPSRQGAASRRTSGGGIERRLRCAGRRIELGGTDKCRMRTPRIFRARRRVPRSGRVGTLVPVRVCCVGRRIEP